MGFVLGGCVVSVESRVGLRPRHLSYLQWRPGDSVTQRQFPDIFQLSHYTDLCRGLIAYQEKAGVIPWRWAANTFRSRAQSNTFSYNYIAILGRWL